MRHTTSLPVPRAVVCAAGALLPLACLAPPATPDPVNLARLPGVVVDGTADPRPFYALPNAFDAGTTRINDLAYTYWIADGSSPSHCRWARLKLPVPARLERVRVHPKGPLRKSHISLLADGELVAHVQVEELLETESLVLEPTREVSGVQELVIVFSRAVGAVPVPYVYAASIEEIEVLGHAPGAVVAAATPGLAEGDSQRFECPVRPPVDVVAKAIDLEDGEYRFQLWEPLDWPAKMDAHGDASVLNARRESEVEHRDDVECIIYSCRYRVRLELDRAVGDAAFHLVSVDAHAPLTPTHFYAIKQFPRHSFGAAGPSYGQVAARVSEPISHGADVFVLQSADPLEVEQIQLGTERGTSSDTVLWDSPHLVYREDAGSEASLPLGGPESELAHQGIIGIDRAVRVHVDGVPRYLLVRYRKGPGAFCAEGTDLFELSDPPRIAAYRHSGCDV